MESYFETLPSNFEKTFHTKVAGKWHNGNEILIYCNIQYILSESVRSKFSEVAITAQPCVLEIISCYSDSN